MAESDRAPRSAVPRVSGRLLLVGLLLLAGASRLAWLVELRDHPATATHGWEASDMHFFHLWGRVIASGDWLTDRVLHPPPPIEVAREHFAAHPDERERWTRLAEQDPRSVGPEEALWEHWMGGKRFHQAPLYPYLLACIFLTLGSSTLPVFTLQAGLGVASIWLLHRLTEGVFDTATAHVTAGLAILYAPFLHFEATLLRVPLLIFSSLLVTWLAQRALRSTGSWRWLGVGIAAGVAALAKPTLALLGAGLGLHLAWVALRSLRTAGLSESRQRVGPPAALALGVLLAICPLVLRNLAVGVQPFSLGSTGALTFITANAGDQDPARPGSSKHTARILSDSDGRFGPAAVATLRTHEGVRSYARLLLRRLDVTLHWYERPNNTSYYHARAYSRVLPLLPISFGLIGPLALVGLFSGWRRWTRDLPFVLLLLSVTVPLLTLQQVFGRYRLALLPVLLPLAGWIVVSLFRQTQRRRWRSALLLALSTCAIGAWSNRDLQGARSFPFRPVDFEVSHELFFRPRAAQAASRADVSEQLRLLEQELAGLPDLVHELAEGGRAATPSIAACSVLAAGLESERAALLRALGREHDSAEAARRAAALFEAARPPGAR